MKKILGTLLILTNIVIFSGCILNEDEKFNPVALKIESTDLTQTTRDEYTIPAGGGQLTVYSTEEKNPFLLHAKVGSYLASKKYGVTDPDILNAILNHTTGRPDMSLLEKIVWLSDYIEPGRKQAPNLPEIRRIAFEDLDKALIMALENTLSYLKGGNMEIDSMTQKTYDFYKNGGNV